MNPPRPPHEGYLELCKYYIQWYKTGVQPKIEEEGLFYVYRTHPKDAVATHGNPVLHFHGDVSDSLYLTTMLKSPAQLVVSSGGKESQYPMAAGLNNVEVPFNPGAQHFSLSRNGKTFVELEGEPILAEPYEYNFFPTTGFVYVR